MKTNRWIGVVCHWGDESDCGKGSRPLHTLQVLKLLKSCQFAKVLWWFVKKRGDGDYNLDHLIDTFGAIVIIMLIFLQDTFGVGARRSTSKGGTGGG